MTKNKGDLIFLKEINLLLIHLKDHQKEGIIILRGNQLRSRPVSHLLILDDVIFVNRAQRQYQDPLIKLPTLERNPRPAQRGMEITWKMMKQTMITPSAYCGTNL